jgi:hypothetical protein
MINAGVAPTFDDLAEFTHHPQRCERRVEHQAQAFPGEVVDQGQDARAPAAGERVHHEVERPAQVLILRDRRCARVPKARLRPPRLRRVRRSAFAHKLFTLWRG